MLPTTPTHPMIVMNGDLITQFDVGQMLSFHSNGGYAATVGVRPYEAHVPFGVTYIDGDRLTAIREKPVIQMLVNAGIYVISPRLLDLVPAEGEVPITDLFARALSSDLPVGAHLINDEWIDVGRHDELNRARGRE